MTLLVLSTICCACGGAHSGASRRVPTTAAAVTATQTVAQPIDPSKFAPGACVAFPPTASSGQRTASPPTPTVFIDAGHGGPDPGAVGTTTTARMIREADLTLAVALETKAILNQKGYRVVVSRTRDTTVLRLGPDDRSGGVLTVEGSHEDLLARDACANEAGANILVGIYFDAGAPGSAGAMTGYDAVRPFAARNLTLARLLQADVLQAMNAQGWDIPDEGVKRDSGLGSALNSAGLAYGHLVLLGPAFGGYVPAPSRMPGALIEPLFVTDPVEGSLASSPRGQEVIAGAVARAIEQYFATPSRPILTGKIPDLLPTRQHVVALTFDAGADNAGAPKILAALAQAQVTATFFMTGRWAELYPHWAQRIAALYPIGNHTFDHQDLLSLTLPEVRGELLNAAAAIKRAIGQPPLPLFRFPYGSSSAATLALVNRLGYTAVGWTVDTLGWEGTSMGQTRASVFSRALAHLQPGEIILMHTGANPHDQSTLDADALPAIISAIRARGYGFVALNQYF